MSAPNQSSVDIDSFLDLADSYDNQSSYQSPTLSAASSSKQNFASPINAAVPTPAISSSSQTLSGPSHNYELYRQQTGFVPGALTSTMAVNQTNNTGYQEFGGLDYLAVVSPEDEMFDFNTSPSQNTVGGSEMDMDFGSPESQLYSTVNPSKIEQPVAVQPSTNAVGRLWPGAHSQAAMAKAQAQQRQQQQLMQQQQQQQQQQMQRQATQQPKARGKAPQPSDPLVEQKITQLLNSMRAKPSSLDGSDSQHLPRRSKEEEEMDEDERLLASEEGKKLSSKERRQLRNKVSARAFRSRRKGESRTHHWQATGLTFHRVHHPAGE